VGGKGDQCVGLTTLPPSCADCHEICEPQPPGTFRACPGLYRDCFIFIEQDTESAVYYIGISMNSEMCLRGCYTIWLLATID
jgi:hypothetical protein